MVSKVFGIFDAKAGIFSGPTFNRLAKGQAIRDFIDIARNPESSISKHPGDFTLFELGEFDDNTGQYVNLEAKSNLGTALEWLSKEN